jgi:WD40 repeat protein
MPDLFISYSRKDKDFVRRLDESLKNRGREAWVDWEDIRPTEDFMQAIYGAIEGVDTFVFVLTPDSVASVVCGREIAHAVAHNKRMVPVVARDVSPETVPEALAKLNWIFCRESDDFEKATDTLITAFDTDLEWVHAHTRLLTRAIEWENKGKNNSFVLRGDDLRSAEQWLAEAVAQKERQPTALQTEYIIASRKAAARRQRITLAAVSFGLVIAIVLAVLAWFQRNEAVRQARIALSRGLSAIAQQKAATETDVGLLLAAHATRLDAGPSAKSALLAAIQAHPRLQRLLWPGARTSAADFSPDGRRFATADVEGGISIWDAATWRRLVHLPAAHEDEIWAILFLPGGKQLVTASLDKTAAVWDVESGKQVGQRMTGHTDQVLCAAVSPDGRVLATAGLDRTIRLWDLGQQRIVRTIVEAHSGGVRSLAFTRDGSRLVSGGFEGALRVWDAADGQSKPGPEKTHSGMVMRLAFKPDGTLLASAGKDGAIQFWDPKTWKQQGEPLLEYHKDVGGLAFSPDGKQLAAGGWDGVVRLWNLGPEGETTEKVFRYHKNQVWQVTFSPDGRLLASAGWDGAVALWDTDGSTSFRQELRIYSDEVEALAFSPRGDVLGVGDEKGNVHLHKIANASERCPVLQGQNGEIVGLMFSPSGSLLAAGSVDGTVQLWDAPGRKSLWKNRQHGAGVFSLAFSPNEKMLVSAGGDGVLVRWAIESGQPLSAPVRAHSKGAGSAVVAFSASGKYFASGGRGGDVVLWDAQTGQQMRVLLKGESEMEGVDGIAFSPDGRKLVAAKGAWLYLWDEGNWATPSKFTAGHGLAITQIAFSPDSRTVLAGGGDGLIYFWDAETKQAMPEPLRGWSRSVWHLALSPHGTHLAASFGGGFPPVLWNLETHTWLSWACQMANRDLRPAEWTELVGPFPQVSICPPNR